jgi:hypothetical protein
LLREEAFRGKHMDKAPDLTLVLRDRSFLSILRADQPLKPRRMPYGTHHPHGVLFARGPGIRSGTELSLSSIVDVGPTLLYSLGLAVPETMEGAPILAAFEPSFVAAHPVSTDRTDAVGTGAVRVRDVALDAESEARVRRMQRLLGY